MTEPKLCPNCPYISFIPIVKSEQVCYTRQCEELTPMKLCQKLRALAIRHNWKFQTCPYFPESERIDLYATAAAASR